MVQEDAPCLSLDGHTVDKEENFCLKPSLTCQHNSGMHAGNRGRAAEVQIRVSVQLFRRQSVLQCFHTVTFALKIKHTRSSM